MSAPVRAFFMADVMATMKPLCMPNCEIVEENIALYKTDGKSLLPNTAAKEYFCKFFLRTGKELHQALAIRSLQTGESLNNFCLKALRKMISRPNF